MSQLTSLNILISHMKISGVATWNATVRLGVAAFVLPAFLTFEMRFCISFPLSVPLAILARENWPGRKMEVDDDLDTIQRRSGETACRTDKA